MENQSFESLCILCDLFTIHFDFLFAIFTPATPEQPSIQDLSAPKGEIYEPPPSEHPILSSSYELRPNLIALVQESSFSGFYSKNPYHHLREFELVCSCYAIAGMSHDTLRWKLFPFSLVEEARQWYTHTLGSVNGNWSELRDKFCLKFFPQSRIVSLRRDILRFQ